VREGSRRRATINFKIHLVSFAPQAKKVPLNQLIVHIQSINCSHTINQPIPTPYKNQEIY